MNDDTREEIKVWALGLLSFGPLLSLLGACFFDAGPEATGLLFTGGVFGLRFIMGLIYTGQVWRNRKMETTTKVFWTLGLLVFFSVLVIPYYWFKFYWEPHRMDKLFSV